MNKFVCDKCNKIFNKKSHYRLHINKANGCIIDDETDDNYDIIYNDKNVKNIILNQPELIILPLLKNSAENIIVSNKIILEHPIEINNYHGININNEYYLLNLLSYINKDIITVHENIYIYNFINSPIINIYLNIQTNYKKLFQLYENIVKESNKNNEEKYYNWLYNQYCELADKSTINACSIYLFLYKERDIKIENLEEIYNLIKNIKIINIGLNKILPHDYIYQSEYIIDINNYIDNKFIITCDDSKENKKKFNNYKIISVIPKKIILIKK